MPLHADISNNKEVLETNKQTNKTKKKKKKKGRATSTYLLASPPFSLFS